MNQLVRKFDKFFDEFPTFREDMLFPIQQHFNDIVREFFDKGSIDKVKSRAGYPRMDIGVEGDEFVIRAAVSGVEEKDLKVEILPGRILQISGATTELSESYNEQKYYTKELRHGSFSRQVQIPEKIEGDPVAELKNGILTLKWNLPQVDKPPDVRQIKINTA